MAPFTVINGPASICTGQGTFTTQNQPPNTTLSWSSDNASALSVDANGVATRQNNFNGGTNVIATVSNACTSVNVTKYVDVGAGQLHGYYQYCVHTYPVQGTVGITVNNSCSTVYLNLTSPYDPGVTYKWSVGNQSSSGVSYSFSQNTANVSASAGKQISINCYGQTTSCGNTPTVTFNIFNISGGFRMAVYPNPASQDMAVAALKNDDQNQAKFQDQGMATDQPVQESDLIDIDATVRLLDKNNAVIREGKLNKGKLNLSVAKLPDGIYYLQMIYEDKQIRKQIEVKH